jgi:hypothetical protein
MKIIKPKWFINNLIISKFKKNKTKINKTHQLFLKKFNMNLVKFINIVNDNLNITNIDKL